MGEAHLCLGCWAHSRRAHMSCIWEASGTSFFGRKRNQGFASEGTAGSKLWLLGDPVKWSG